MGTSGPILLCRECGYDLRGSDLTVAAHRCPECGEVNIPFDPRVAPITEPAWPRGDRLLLGFLWPGVSLAACTTLAFCYRPTALLFGTFVLLLFVACLVWPPFYADRLAATRIPRIRRGRWVAVASSAGMLGNLAVAVLLGVGILAARPLFRMM